jgi:hypothetical protein
MESAVNKVSGRSRKLMNQNIHAAESPRNKIHLITTIKELAVAPSEGGRAHV